MKKWIALALSLVLCLGVLAGCGGTNNGTNGEAEGESGEKTLTVAVSKEPASLIPYESNDTGTAPITHQYCEPLLTVDTEMNLQPCLAESWEQVDDTHYRFHLREGVTFHDGSPFTAEDVLFSLEQWAASPAASELLGPVDLAGTTIEDDYTITIALSEPYPAFLNICSLDLMGIVSKAAMEADPEGYANNPIGTGPFKFVEWATGDYIMMEANDDWWGGEIAFDKLMLRYIPEATTRAVEVESGGVDIANIDISSVPTIAENPDLTLVNQPILNTSYVSFNCSVAPFDNVKVRQAISLAIDCDAIVEAIYGDYSETAKSFISPVMWGYHEADSEYMGYDPDRAKELLAEAGYADGFSCTMISNGQQSMAEMIQANLAAVGINVELNVTDFSNWLDALVNGKQEMYIGGWTVPSGDVTEAYAAFDSTCFGSGGNRSFYANDQADALINTINTETDKDARLAACQELQELLADECVTIGLNVGYTYWGVSSNVSGFEVLSTQSPNYYGVTFAE